MEVQLTAGICTTINDPLISTKSILKRRPVVQILRAVQARRNNAVQETFWNIVISDGEHWIQGFLSKDLSWMAEEGLLTRFIVIAIQQACRNLERSLFIVQELEIIEFLDHRIGTPQALRIGNKVPLIPSVPPTPSSSTSQPLPPRTPQISPPSSTMQTRKISELNQYINNWQVKARVIQKGPLLTWSKGAGSGVRFNVIFKDASKEIRAVSFEKSVHQALEENKVYLISGATIELAKMGYNSNSKYEMHLTRQTRINECHDTADVPEVVTTYTPLQDINTVEANTSCGNSPFVSPPFCPPLIRMEDVIAVVQELGTIEPKRTRYGEKVMRSLGLVDEAMVLTTLTLWGTTANEFDCKAGAVILVRRAKVSRYQGVVSLSANSDTTTEIEPSIPDSQRLRRWYRSLRSEDFERLSQLSTSAGNPPSLLIQDVIQLKLDEPKQFTIRAIATRIFSDKLMYPGCPSCRKKVIVDEGKWVCSNSECTAKISEPRYTIRLRVQDPTGDLYLDGFDEFGLQIFGQKSANELHKMKRQDKGAYDNLVNETLNQLPICHFTCEASVRSYNDRSMPSYSVKKMLAVNYLDEVRKQISLIQ